MASDRVEKLRYFLSFHKVEIQRTTEYIVWSCFALSQRPNLPDRVTLKEWLPQRQEASQSDLEINLIREISKYYQDTLPVPQYLGHFIKNKMLFLFVSALDKSLHEEIMERRLKRQPWSELELWHHLERLSRLVYYLHTLRIVHRNVSPDTLFLRGTELHLFHFDDSKRLGPQDTVQDATIRGAVNFLSPQAEAAQKGGFHLTYEVSRKDDVWGLGRTLLDMASLNINETLKSHYQKSQSEFEAIVKNLIGNSYSNVLKAAITGLLILDCRQRPDFESFYEWIRNMYHSKPCMQCRSPLEQLWFCQHVLCTGCLHAKLVRMLLFPTANPQLCECSVSIPPPFIDFITLLPIQTQKIATLLLNPEKDCPKECGGRYKVLIEKDNKVQPQFVRCPNCKFAHCSFCDATSEHKVLGIKRLCQEFVRTVG